MKKLISLLVVVVAFALQGCLVSPDIQRLVDVGGKQIPVLIPESVLQQGESAAREYVAGKYPFAVPFMDQIFPRKTGPVGPPQFVQVPIIRTTNITLVLKDEINGSKTLDGNKVASVIVEIKAKAGKAELPATDTRTVTLGEYVTGLPDQPAPDVETPSDPQDPVTDPQDPPDDPVTPPGDEDLPINPDIPVEQ